MQRPELESDPERSFVMDSALSDPHNASAEAGSPANGTTRPPSTPEGIALAYGSLLLMALLPIFFGALRSVRCARGKVGSAAKPVLSTPTRATADTGPPRPPWERQTPPLPAPDPHPSPPLAHLPRWPGALHPRGPVPRSGFWSCPG